MSEAVIDQGLSNAEAAKRLRKLGPPAETPGNVTPWRPSAGS